MKYKSVIKHLDLACLNNDKNNKFVKETNYMASVKALRDIYYWPILMTFICDVKIYLMCEPRCTKLLFYEPPS